MKSPSVEGPPICDLPPANYGAPAGSNNGQENVIKLRHRERATADMVRAIEVKIERLTSARAERLSALQKIRSALAQAVLAGPGAHDRHANIH